MMTQSDPATVSRKLVNHAIALLSQQCWCWGKDIERRKGNWLLELGFERLPPPEQLRDRGSVYQMSLPGDRFLVLRGFGVFLGQAELGGVFLPRFDFFPQYTDVCQPDSPPWTKSHLPEFQPPNAENRSQCARLTHDVIEWIADYETDVADRLGHKYRDRTLRKWNDGKNIVFAAEEFARTWKQLRIRLGADLEMLGLPG